MAKVVKTGYQFKSRYKNPDYESGIKELSLRPCLILPKSDKLLIKTAPKWFTNLSYCQVDNDSGEVVGDGVYRTDDFKRSNGSKIKALDAFCSHFQPLYQQRKVSLLFLTFTRANRAKITFKGMMNNLTQRFKRQAIFIRGFVWTAEISDRTFRRTQDPEDLHWHYHLCIAIDRVRWVTIPSWAKFNSLWGQRTGVEFVKKNIRHYMAKYFAKNDSRVVGLRSFGKSKKFA